VALDSDTTEPLLVTETLGAVVVCRLNRPHKANAFNPELVRAVGRALLSAESDPSVRCLVLTGTGDRRFCSGRDLGAFDNGDPHPLAADVEEEAAFSRLLQGGAEIPMVAAVNASAVAGGFELVLSCDLAVAADTARFGLPETKRGLFPAGGGAYLAARIPLAVALELTMIGDTIDARRAHDLGLINRVVPPDHVLDEAIKLAWAIARNSPLGVRASRAIVRASVEDMARARQLGQQWQPRVFASNDAVEGGRAFVEKRSPEWTGT
jgi:enoyl-CoA hydratase